MSAQAVPQRLQPGRCARAGAQRAIPERSVALMQLADFRAPVFVKIVLVHHQQGFAGELLREHQVAIQQVPLRRRARRRDDQDDVEIGCNRFVATAAVRAAELGAARFDGNYDAAAAFLRLPVDPVATHEHRQLSTRNTAPDLTLLVRNRQRGAVVRNHATRVEAGVRQGNVIGSVAAYASSASIFAAQMKSFCDSPPMACVL